MAQRDKDDLKSQSSTLFPDNTAQEITPARKRSFDSDMVDSNLNLVEETEQEIAGPVKFVENIAIDWGEDSLATWATSSGNYLIRATRSATGVSQAPVVQELLIDAVSFFEWDKDGNLHVNSLEMADCPQGVGSEPTGLSAGTVWANSSASIGNSYQFYITTTDT